MWNVKRVAWDLGAVCWECIAKLMKLEDKKVMYGENSDMKSTCGARSPAPGSALVNKKISG